MAHVTVKIKVSTAWWLRIYLHGVAITCMLTGREPDWVKVSGVVMRAVKTKVVTTR